MRIGDIAIVGLQAELAASAGAQLKANSPFPHTMVVTMVDGGAKYMPDAQSYERFTYEARNSRYARGAAELTASGIDSLLKEMKQSPDARPQICTQPRLPSYRSILSQPLVMTL